MINLRARILLRVMNKWQEEAEALLGDYNIEDSKPTHGGCGARLYGQVTRTSKKLKMYPPLSETGFPIFSVGRVMGKSIERSCTMCAKGRRNQCNVCTTFIGNEVMHKATMDIIQFEGRAKLDRFADQCKKNAKRYNLERWAPGYDD